MATTATTWTQVQTTVGRALTAAEQAQATMWIGDAERIIAAGFGVRGWDFTSVHGDVLDMVIREAVAERIKNPVAKRTSHEVAVDDARFVDRFDATTGQITIRDEWWSLMAPVAVQAATAWSISPSYIPGY